MKFTREYRMHIKSKIQETEINFHKCCGGHSALCKLSDKFEINSPEYDIIEQERKKLFEKIDYYYKLLETYQDILKDINNYFEQNNI